MKNISPLVGFNTNVRHKGKVFHIQTEDSGVRHPHVITHLFADGGRILKSTKASYAEILNEPDLTDRVRTLMKDQHKAMFMALRDGSLDTTIEEFVRGTARPSTTTAAAQPKPAAAPPPQPIAEAPAPSVRADPAAAQAWSAAAPSSPQPAATSPDTQPKAVAPQAAPDAGRYVASRPAAIFASARPTEGGNVFGEEMISDKSLDEVILGFLADEVDAGGEKSGDKH